MPHQIAFGDFCLAVSNGTGVSGDVLINQGTTAMAWSVPAWNAGTVTALTNELDLTSGTLGLSGTVITPNLGAGTIDTSGIVLQTGTHDGSGFGNTGDIKIWTGDIINTGSGSSGTINILTGEADTGSSGNIFIETGFAALGDTSGSIVVQTGLGTSASGIISFAPGGSQLLEMQSASTIVGDTRMILTGLPTTDPAVLGSTFVDPLSQALIVSTGTATTRGIWNAGTVSAVGSSLAVSSNTLALATISAGQVLANTGGGAAVPAGVSVSALLDAGIASVQGDILYRGASGWVALAPGTAGQLLKSGGAAANPTWFTQPYLVGAFNAGTLTNTQTLAVHRFGGAVTFPSNFGTANCGEVSSAASMINATGANTLTIAKCPSASDPTSGGSWTNVGSVVISASGHAGVFTTSGTVAFAQNDYVRIVNQATADTTLAGLAITLAGDR